MTESQYQPFKEDIAKNGQLEPIDILDGMVIDGRHRQRACLELGITPKYRFLPEDTDPLQHILSKNVLRRNTDKSPLATAAVKIYLLSHGLRWSGVPETENNFADFAQVQMPALTQA